MPFGEAAVEVRRPAVEPLADLRSRFARRAADPAVSGDVLLGEMRASGVPARRSAVFLWRQQFRAAPRHRPNSLAGRIASALQAASPERMATLRLRGDDPTAAVFRRGRQRLYAVARQLGLYPAETRN